MKLPITIFAICLLLLFQGLSAYSQFTRLGPAKLKVLYTLTWQEDSLNPFHLRDNKMVMLTGAEHSLFASYGTFFLDSVARSNPNITSEKFRQLNPPRHHQQYRINKNFQTQQITISDRIFVDAFKYTLQMDAIQWRLTGYTGAILGYSVQKAIASFGGRIWEAWFTREIPHSDGPYKFSGLPGLILKVHDTRRHYAFEAKSISATLEMIYKYTRSDIIHTTFERFLEAQKKFNQDFINNIRASGVPLHESFNRDAQRLEEGVRRRNNPIVLRADQQISRFADEQISRLADLKMSSRVAATLW